MCKSEMRQKVMQGKFYASHTQFADGELVSAITPRCGTLPHNRKTSVIVLVFAAVAMVLCASATSAVKHYFCKYCGHKTTSVNSLTASQCLRHPNGPGKGRHALYEGEEKPTYTCKYCGFKSSSIASLTSSKCQRHPEGPQKGRHAPAL